MKKLYCLVIVCFLSHAAIAQLDSILNQGVYRTYILHLPLGYTATKQYPLVINMHGLNSNAAEQQVYTQFDLVADASGFIVVYPNAINSSWALAGTTDVNFISALIIKIGQTYALNTCLFSTGMSDGAFMTYKLACTLPQRLTAIAPVAGNMSTTLQNSCAPTYPIPLMHFHGTADPLVNYNGTIGIPSVTTTINWWSLKTIVPRPP